MLKINQIKLPVGQNEQQLEKKDYNQLYLIIIAFLIVVIIILGIKNYIKQLGIPEFLDKNS